MRSDTPLLRPPLVRFLRRAARTPSGAAALALCGTVALSALPSAVGAQSGPVPGPVAPLFAEETPLVLRIEADFHQLKDDREEDNEERPGRVVRVEADGTESEWSVQVRTRGRFRLQSDTCDFPPIRLNFVKGEVEGGIFDGQDKIKLVTHCRDRYEDEVLREYLVYRIYNELAPESFRVRMARVTYVDTAGEEDTIERMAFFIEMEEALAERLGGTIIPDEELADGLHPARIPSALAARVTLFAYMVGNTDFSMYSSTGEGLHNIVPIQMEGGRVMPVPYDFDWTGLVNAPYARPDRSLGIRRVTDRVFRGLCRPDVDWPAQYAAFQARRGAITALVDGLEGLSDDGREDARDFLDEFWETIGDERDARRRIEEACRPV